MIVLLIVISVFVLIGGVAFVFLPPDKDGNPVFRKGRLWLPLLGLLLLVFFLSAPVQIGAGQRGVVTRFGAVTDKTFDEGLHFRTPFVESVVKMDVTTNAFTLATGAASRDLQAVTTEVTLNWSLDPARVNEIWQNLRGQHESRIIANAVPEAVKSTTARFAAEELVTKRELVKTEIEATLTTRLGEVGILLSNLALTNFQFSEVFDASIEAKETAKQDALTAEAQVALREAEARQAIAAAEGQKQKAILEAEGRQQAQVLDAQGRAEAIRLQADAEAYANDVLNASLTEDVLRWQAITTLNPSIQTIILPGGTELILSDEILNR